MTVVFDAGQNSEASLAHLASTHLQYIGSVPTSGCPDLAALPASGRAVVDRGRFGGVTACDARRETYGAERRTISTRSPEPHTGRARGSFRQMKEPHVVSVLPDVPLDRAQHPRPRLHLRARPQGRPPDAPEGPPGRAGPVRARAANSPPSGKPCCCTKATADGPGPTACTPKPPRSRTSSAISST